MRQHSRRSTDKTTIREGVFQIELLEERTVPAIFTVTGVGDGAGIVTPDSSGGFTATTLRGAVNAASSNGEADTIRFDPLLSGATINIVNGELMHDDTGQSLTIQGFASNRVVLDGSSGFRILHNSQGAGALSISGLRLTGAVDTPGSGGAVFDQSSNVLTIANSVITGNSASAVGGGVAAYSANITGSTISDNIGYLGGGLYTFAGGSVTNSTISGNVADYSGGGIFNLFGNVTVTNSTISGNTASYVEAPGGGIYSYEEAVVQSSTITGNSAGSSGGGVHARQYVDVSNSILMGNESGSDGGALSSGSQLNVSNSTIANNTASYDGGGIAADGNITLSNSTISGNSAGSAGGGVFANVQATVSNSTIANNTSDGGGGIYVGSSATFNSTIVAGNFSTGGDVSGTVNATSSLIQDPTGATIMGTGNLTGVDPRLSALGNFGGNPINVPSGPSIRQVHSLLTGSPAIDAGDPAFTAPPNFDERGVGFLRVAGARVDIGAFEAQSTDVGVTKSAAVNGSTVTFTIVVTNNGPGRTRATVTDAFPAGLSNVSFTSIAAGGAQGNDASGTGNINDLINLPSGSSVTYTATATISSSVTNTATVAVLDGAIDPNPGNNSASASAAPAPAPPRGRAFIQDGILFVAFTPLDDVGVFSDDGGFLAVTINGEQFGPFDPSLFTEVVVDALEGDDLIQFDTGFTFPFSIDGNDGTDTLDLSGVAIDLLVMIGSGQSSVDDADFSFSDVEALITGSGNDTFIVTDLPSGSIDGGDGTNTLDLTSLGFPVDVTLFGVSGQVDGLSFDNIHQGLLPDSQPNTVTSDGTIFENASSWTADGSTVTVEGDALSSVLSLADRRSRSSSTGSTVSIEQLDAMFAEADAVL